MAGRRPSPAIFLGGCWNHRGVIQITVPAVFVEIILLTC